MTRRDVQQPERAIAGPRIVVVGVTGSGKTTIARQLARIFHLPHIELDALYWQPNWTPAPVEEFRRRIFSVLPCDAWVVDGNYSTARDYIWPKATMLVWLDYPFSLILWRLWWRILRRCLKREELWNGNRESLRTQFFSRNSLFLWALKTYRRHKDTYSVLFQQPEHAYLHVVRLRSPSETQTWFNSLT